MKNKFALCFRPVVIETDTEKENRDCNRNIVDDHHLDDAKNIESHSISKGSKRSFSFSDVNRSTTQPNSTPRHDGLRRRNSSSKKTAGSISSAWKTLFRSSSPKVVPKGSGEFEEENEDMGIKKNKGSKDTNSSKNQIRYSKSTSSGSSSSLSSTTTSHVTSPSSSTSSSMNSSEMNHNINEVSNLKRSMLARSNSTSNTNKKPKTTKARDNKALKSSKENNQEGFVFYLVILALVFNMLCGLVYAIVLTSLSLYFMGRHRSHQRPVNALKLAELRKSKRKIMHHV